MEDIFGRLYFGAIEMNHTHVIWTKKKGKLQNTYNWILFFMEFKNIQNNVMYFLGINKSVVKVQSKKTIINTKIHIVVIFVGGGGNWCREFN